MAASSSTSSKSRVDKKVLVESITHVGEDEPRVEVDEEAEENPFAEITNAVKRHMEKNNERMFKSFEEKTQQAINTAVKRTLDKQAKDKEAKKSKKDLDFKSKGNEIRYGVNEEVMGKIAAAIDAIDEKDLEEAKKELTSGNKILSKQQKLIRIADREENGWEVVKHYISDDLASDSDDEKALKKARKEAMDTINKRLTKRMSKKSRYFRNDSQRKYKWQQGESSQRDWSASRAAATSYDRSNSYDRRRQVCYKCGREGHMQYSCQVRYNR